MSDPRTCNLALEAADQLYVPTNKSWRLNERMYGGLTGLDKKAMGWPWDGHGAGYMLGIPGDFWMNFMEATESLMVVV